MQVRTRSIPKYLALILEQFELEQPELLTIQDIQMCANLVGSTIKAPRIAFELKNRGWLLPTSARGVYEFSPGANAGAYSKGGKLLNIKAVALAHPEVQWFYSYQSALYFHHIVDQMPDKPQITIKTNSIKNVPYSFTKLTHSVFNAKLAPVIINNNPVERLETLLVHICSKPAAISNWFVYKEKMQDIWRECDIDKLHQELNGRSLNTKRILKKLLNPIINEVQFDF